MWWGIAIGLAVGLPLGGFIGVQVFSLKIAADFWSDQPL